MKRLFLSLSALVLASAAQAFDPDTQALEDETLIKRYPAGSLVQPTTAERALAEVNTAQGKLEELSKYSERRCNENIFVNRCIDNVKAATKRQQRRFADIEYEAKTTLRKEKTRQNELAQREREAKAATGPKASLNSKKPRTASTTTAKKTKQAAKKRAEDIDVRRAKAETNAAREDKSIKGYEQRLRKREARVQRRAQAIKDREAKNKEKAKK